MAYKCQNCGKGVQYGHFVSHAKNRTRRIFKPNLKRATIMIKGVKEKMLLCAKCVRTVKKKNAAK
ncbi:MAG: 50S ribosomal protein L28 [Patescibacteria group bacterium]